MEAILEYAHLDFNKRKISLTEEIKQINSGIFCKPKKDGDLHVRRLRIVPKARKFINVSRRKICPIHKGHALSQSKRKSEQTIIDLAFYKYGIRKTITKYWGYKGYCSICRKAYKPNKIDKFLKSELFGHRFKAWVVYQRVILRLPYKAIVKVMEDQFNEKVSLDTIIRFVMQISNYYKYTERLIIQRVLSSPFIHIDETKISIKGYNYYVWVFTNGAHVFFKLTETRETTIVKNILENYEGIIITDFYGGYDSINCKQQKCWSHLIGDINEDLWKNPFDKQFEEFVGKIKDVILPVLLTVEKHGLKKRNLYKYKKIVNKFYKNTIDSSEDSSELVIKYKKRFEKYKERLFTFIEQDGISWNNNMAERALRHLAVQRKISGSFSESTTHEYLLLLGIAQTCRFQDKSFLKFLLSGEKDLDKFKKTKPIKSSRPVNKKNNVSI